MDIVRRPKGSDNPGKSGVNQQYPQRPEGFSKPRPKTSWRQSLWIRGLILIALLMGLALGWQWHQDRATGIDKSRYQAVKIHEGDMTKVYFGKLSNAGSGNMAMKDVYYLQDQTTEGAASIGDADSSTDTSANPTLVKHGTELWSPEDVLYIRKEQIVYWENLKSTGKIVEAIRNYQAR
jgi:hypothetical protein